MKIIYLFIFFILPLSTYAQDLEPQESKLLPAVIQTTIDEYSIEKFLTHKGIEYRIWIDIADNESLKITEKGNESKTILIEESVAYFDPKQHFKVIDGILYIDAIDRAIDLENFNAEISFIGDTKPFKKVEDTTNPQSPKDVPVLSTVKKTYVDLVAEARKELIIARNKYPNQIDDLALLGIKQNPSSMLERIAKILKYKQSVKLLGESGSGKTTLVQIFAKLIAAGKIKGIPRTAQILVLDLNQLNAGTKWIGTLETKIEILKSYSEALHPIIYADEFHIANSIGKHSGSNSNILQALKPSLADGSIRFIAVSTSEEWNNAFGSDPALNRRFSEAIHQTPQGHELVAMINDALTARGFPTVPENIIQKAIEYSDRFAISGAQPSKAIQLLTEAQSLVSEEELTLKQSIDSEALQNAVQNLYHQDPDFFSSSKLLSRLRNLNEYFKNNYVGQEHAVKAILNSWLRKLTDVGSSEFAEGILFFGPPGTGKTEIALRSAEQMGYAFKRIDMQKYKMGNVDEFRYEVFQALKLSPFTVFIFDEVEKAHFVVQEDILPMIQPGNFTVSFRDGNGLPIFERINSSNAIFYMTTNAGSDLFHGGTNGSNLLGYQSSQTVQTSSSSPSPLRTTSLQKITQSLANGHIAEPLLSRISEIVPMGKPNETEFKLALELLVKKKIESESIKKSKTYSITNSNELVDQMMKDFISGTSDFRDAHKCIKKHLLPLFSKSVLKDDFAQSNKIALTWSTLGCDCDDIFSGSCAL